MMTSGYEEKLISIVKGQTWLTDVLKAVRSLDLPDWYISGGAIRNSVWNFLHNYSGRFHIRDIDIAYFDRLDLKPDKEMKSEETLHRLCPDLTFEVINQARAHTFHIARPQATSSFDSIGYWSETSSCVGVRLEKDDLFNICAPYGLNDLLDLKVRPIPEPKRDMKLYRDRINEKQWNEIWPKLQIFEI